jgi:hypothetical protein
MKGYRDSRVTGTRFGLVMLTGILALGARPGAAPGSEATQAPDTTRMTLIFAVFPGQTAAKQVMGDMKTAQQVGHLESYAVVSKDQNGHVSVQQKQGKKRATPSSSRASKSVDGVVALLGRTPSGGPTDTAGYTAGTQAGISKADVDKIQRMLTAGTSAIVFVVADSWVGDMRSAMEQAHAKQLLEAKLLPQP